MRRYRTSFQAHFYNVPEGEWWLLVRELLLSRDWDKPAARDWEVRYEFHAVHGEPLLSAVSVKPQLGAPADNGLTARLLRKLSIDDAYGAARRFLVRQLEAAEKDALRASVEDQYTAAFGDDPTKRALFWESFQKRQLPHWTPDSWPVRIAGYETTEALKGARRRPGRRGHDDAFYAAFAAEYVELLETAPDRPVAELAEQRSFSQDYVRDVLHRARKRGLLTSPPRGRAGGRLTDKALALLRPSSKEKE